MFTPERSHSITAPTAPQHHKIQSVLAHWEDTGAAHHFQANRTLEAVGASSSPLPADLPPELRSALASMGIEDLYLHQARALAAADRGEDVVIATPTASGKTLCYNLPVFRALLEDHNARAIYLFPTKALARDQVENARALARGTERDVGIAVYDGDTPPDERRAARNAHIIATNPDMLHAGLLPHHPRWARFFAGLRYVVVDELHTYRGVFGGHVGNVLRRLQRVAAFHGASPRFIATSATIANPDELGAQLFGRPVSVVRESGAPRGQRHFLLYNPPVIDRALGIRESYLKATCKLTRDLVQANLGTLVFCRSRLAVEVMVRYLRDRLEVQPAGGVVTPGEDAGNVARVRGYRGGYLPDRRRDVEEAMRAGKPAVVVATSALELGIDIGGLDAVVIAGWPGSRAATWQRAGRAGRRLAPSLTVMVSSSDPVDQFVAGDPNYLFSNPPEHARVDPDNASILIPHLKCSAFELPFRRGDRFGPLEAKETGEVLEALAEAELLHRSGEGFHYIGAQYPASEVSLRGQLDENFLVVDEAQGEVIAEVDYRDAPETLHDHAIYQLEGRQYEVRHLDHDEHKAYVQAVDIDYYTTANTNLRLRVLERLEEAGSVARGEVHVLNRVVGFKKIKLHTHENVGYGEVSQPEREMHTQAFWVRVTPENVRKLCASPAEIAGASLGLAAALHTSAALFLMSERSDLGRAVGDGRADEFTAIEGGRGTFSSATPDATGPLPSGPTIFIYDRFPGGTGLTPRLFDERSALLKRAHDLLARCECHEGCPACVGAGRGGEVKALTTRMAALLATEVQAEVGELLPRL
ncbi:MAG: DEAD/DEAH box helicase [Deltaproteobacteria bacterium]|nr:DEAD/DEAH box helicase [Deltaproteobacteria bacterium]